MQALVTGGAGFIGSALVRALVADGWRVRVLDDLSAGDAGTVDPAADLVIGDVADIDTVTSAVAGAVTVFHLAAHRSVPRSVAQPLASDRANTHGTLAVLEASSEADVRRVVYASSSSVYGPDAPRPTPETAAPAPASPYAVSKLAGEHYCRVIGRLNGLCTVALRYFNVYGPGQRHDSPYAQVVPLFITAVAARKPVEIHGDGLQSRDFTYVDDVVLANLRAARAPTDVCGGAAYNVAAGAPSTLDELLGLIEETVGCTTERVWLPDRPGDVRHTHADVTAAARDLGHRPSVGLRDGLRRTVAACDRSAGGSPSSP